MKPRTPELLLVFYIFFGGSRLMAPIVLCQVEAIRAARRAQRKLDVVLDRLNPGNPNLDDDVNEMLEDEILEDEVIQDLLLSLRLSHNNATAYGYLGLLAPSLRLGSFGHSMVEASLLDSEDAI